MSVYIQGKGKREGEEKKKLTGSFGVRVASNGSVNKCSEARKDMGETKEEEPEGREDPSEGGGGGEDPSEGEGGEDPSEGGGERTPQKRWYPLSQPGYQNQKMSTTQVSQGQLL